MVSVLNSENFDKSLYNLGSRPWASSKAVIYKDERKLSLGKTV